jgi:hypothetical protein
MKEGLTKESKIKGDLNKEDKKEEKNNGEREQKQLTPECQQDTFQYGISTNRIILIKK